MSDFWVRKIKTYFQRFDYNKDGEMSQQDFEDIAQAYITFGKLDETKAKELQLQLKKLWLKFMEGHEGNALTVEKLIESSKKLAADPARLRLHFVDALTITFEAIDANGDGSIQPQELELFFEIINFDKSTARATFEAIDTNNDGELSLDEFVAAGIDFFTSEDVNSPSQLFWGPLV